MKGTTFIHLNIQSLLPKLDELKIYMVLQYLEMTEPLLAVEVSPSTSGMSYNLFFCLSCLIPTLNPSLLGSELGILLVLLVSSTESQMLICYN